MIIAVVTFRSKRSKIEKTLQEKSIDASFLEIEVPEIVAENFVERVEKPIEAEKNVIEVKKKRKYYKKKHPKKMDANKK
jgi:hypothetical protein